MLEEIQGARRLLARGKDLVVEGAPANNVILLHEGWAHEYKRSPDGERQILAVRLAGSVIGLSSFYAPASDRGVEALTDIIISEIAKPRLIAAMNASPGLSAGLLASLARDEAIAAQHLANLGRRSAIVRTAHFLLELGVLSNRGKADLPERFECPLSQTHLADALGMTNIHLNRVLRQLRESQLLSVSGGVVQFLDAQSLRRLADFDPSYLD